MAWIPRVFLLLLYFVFCLYVCFTFFLSSERTLQLINGPPTLWTKSLFKNMSVIFCDVVIVETFSVSSSYFFVFISVSRFVKMFAAVPIQYSGTNWVFLWMHETLKVFLCQGPPKLCCDICGAYLKSGIVKYTPKRKALTSESHNLSVFR